MKLYTDTQAIQKFSEVLNDAQTEEVFIQRNDGVIFSIVRKEPPSSPFAVKGIRTASSTQDILDAIEKSRMSN